MPTVPGGAVLSAAPALAAPAVGTAFGAAFLSAAALLACATITRRITVTPGNVRPGDRGTYSPLANDSYVVVPGLIDGIYDT